MKLPIRQDTDDHSLTTFRGIPIEIHWIRDRSFFDSATTINNKGQVWNSSTHYL